MDSLKNFEVIKSTIYQSPEFCEFMTLYNFKSFQLKNKTYFHIYNFGPFYILKSFRADFSQDSMSEIEDLSKNKFGNLLIKVSPNIGFDETLPEKFKYAKSEKNISASKTLIKDLTISEDEMFKSFSENTRYKINRSYREKDRIEIYQNPSNFILNILYNSLSERQKTKNFRTYDLREITKLRDILKENTYVFLAYNSENKLVVSNFYVGYKNKISYFTGSLNTENRNSRAGYQLINEAFKYFKRQGYIIYDFEGLSDERLPKDYEKWLGFSKFKKQFSKEEISYPLSMIKFNSTLLKFVSKFDNTF
jgi:lipid II:glycine glycyltransferase (peptidoglycan interpeptide bridge formation enzyme)